MVKLLICFLKISFLVVLGSSCSQREWYKKSFTEEEKKENSEKLWLGGYWFHYQGSVADQFQLEESRMLDSINAAMWREKAIAYLKRGIGRDFYPYYDSAVKYNPSKWAGFRGYIYLYFYRDFERAIADFDHNDAVVGEVAYSQGQNHDYMRGICYFGLKEYDQALTQLDKYINKVVSEEGEDWVDVYAFLYRGLTLAKLNRLDEAMNEFDRTLKYYPKLSDCFYHKARIHCSARDYEEALALLSKAKVYFKEGYFHQRPYVEVLEQIYIQDIEKLEKEIQQKLFEAA